MKVNNRSTFAIVASIAIALLSCKKETTRKIFDSELLEHVKYLSSDDLSGRMTGTAGDSLAAIYIRDKMMQAGLIPLQEDGFQPYEVTDRISAGVNNFLFVDGEQIDPATGFMPLSFSGNSELKAEVVFAGYGFIIDNDSLKWSDYNGIDVTDKWVLILRGDPEPQKSVSGFIPYENDRDKAMLAKDQGAAGVLMVSGPYTDEEDSFGSLSSEDYSVEIPVLRIKREIANKILSKTNTTIADLEKKINSSMNPCVFKTGTTVSAGAEIIRSKSTTRNVVMILPGDNDSLMHEFVIVGAHFDHLGMGGSSSRARDTVAVHPGADDNASGVSEMIELAERFALTEGSHKRTIIFIAFSGEESGLLGSKYFTDNSSIALAKVNAMINLDMIGRLQDSSFLQVSGVGTAEGLEEIVRSFSDTANYRLSFSEEGYGTSDHSSFYGKNIPVLFFSTGAHLDYHRPSDTWEKINYKGMREISDLLYDVTGYLANSPERLRFQESAPRPLNRAIRRQGVTLGITPDFAGNVKNGLRADFVTPGKPAALGGMKKGDIITSINGRTINNIQDYMYRMGQFRHGQTINVEVLRNGIKEVLLIQL